MRERRVDGQAQIGAGALEVVGERIASANDQLAVARSPGDAHARLEVGDAVVLVVKRVAVAPRAGLSGDVFLARHQVEVGLAILNLVPGRVEFPAQAQVECQVRSDAPIVLVKGSQRVGALTPRAAVDAALDFLRQTQHEIGPAGATKTAA